LTTINIETDLKTLLDATTWTVVGDGVTKLVYIWSESHSPALDLTNPGSWNKTTNQVVIVIQPAQPSQVLLDSANGKNEAFICTLKVYAQTVANIKSALTALKTIFDSQPNLSASYSGIDGNIFMGSYFILTVIKWNKFVGNN